jgi:hypothetical protein
VLKGCSPAAAFAESLACGWRSGHALTRPFHRQATQVATPQFLVIRQQKMPRDPVTKAALDVFDKVSGCLFWGRLRQSACALLHHHRIRQLVEVSLKWIRDERAVNKTKCATGLLDHLNGIKDESADLRMGSVKRVAAKVENSACEFEAGREAAQIRARLQNQGVLAKPEAGADSGRAGADDDYGLTSSHLRSSMID